MVRHQQHLAAQGVSRTLHQPCFLPRFDIASEQQALAGGLDQPGPQTSRYLAAPEDNGELAERLFTYMPDDNGTRDDVGLAGLGDALAVLARLFGENYEAMGPVKKREVHFQNGAGWFLTRVQKKLQAEPGPLTPGGGWRAAGLLLLHSAEREPADLLGRRRGPA